MSKDYQGKQVTIHFDGKKCIHSRECVLGLPQVFVANSEDPWIKPDNADAEELKRVIRNCPSGALSYSEKNAEKEPMPPVNTIRVLENSPYAVNAEVDFSGSECITRMTLCRCGHSKNKPYCDGAHRDIGFIATGEPATQEFKALEKRDGKLAITPLPDGPLELSGNMEIISGTGRTSDKKTDVHLCRCGHSKNKPYCDGTHKVVGFKTEL